MTRSPTLANRRHGRRGAILLIVLTLLALFAVIGLSFVFYAESQANQSRVYRNSVNTPAGQNATAGSGDTAVPDAGVAVNAVLGQMLVPNQANQDSALYGHEPWRLMYGGPLNGIPGGQPGNVPYNGFGLVHHGVVTPLGSFDRADAIRFTRWASPYGNATLNTQIDPETLYTGPIPAPGYNVRTGPTFTKPTGLGVAELFVPKNAGYTYPDRNNALLTALDPLHGQPGGGAYSVIAPSGHRPRLFDPTAAHGAFGLEPTNPAWYTADGYFKTLRPRPIDHMTASDRAKLSANPAFTALGIPLPIPATLTPAQATALGAAVAAGKFVLSEFPMPMRNTDGSVTGDVQNLRHTNQQQHNDSVWVSIGATPVKFRDTYIVPMVAINLTALDGRVNLGVAGNALAAGGTHTSNQGFGPHEINPGVTAASTVGAPAQGLMADPGTASTYSAAAVAIARRTGVTSLPPVPVPLPVPVPPSYPTEAQATSLAAYSSPGTLYPAFPNSAPSGRRVYAVQPFQPSLESGTNTLAFVFPATASSALQLTQAQPRPDVAVSFSGLAGTHDYPGTVAGFTAFHTAPQNSPANQRGNSGFGPTISASNPPTGEALDNPLGFNPYLRHQRTPENNVPTEPQTYPTSDSKRLVARWSDKSVYINDTVLASAVPYPGYARSVAAQFPTAEANRHRAGLTPVSNTLHAPGLAAMDFGVQDASIVAGPTIATAGRRSLQYDPATNSYPFPSFDVVPTSDLAKIVGTNPAVAAGGQPDGDASDVTANYTQNLPAASPPAYVVPRSLANVRAALAAVDVNPALPDYRTVLTAPLSSTNAGNSAVALAARQQLARDIFARLCVSTGASVRFDVNNVMVLPQPPAAPGPTPYVLNFTVFNSANVATPITVGVSEKEYSALRFLAQVAVNIVDDIDTDDVSTAFDWNPAANGVPVPAGGSFDQGTPEPGNSVVPLRNRVVYGVEKPRLVLSEIYCEGSNAGSDMGGSSANADFDIRFFVELLNASPTAGANQVADSAVEFATNSTTIKPYQIEIHQDLLGRPLQTPTILLQANNVLGDVPPAIQQPVIQFIPSLEPATINLTTPTNASDAALVPFQGRDKIEPNNGQFTSTPTLRNGFYVLGPTISTGTPDGQAFVPQPSAPLYDHLISVTQTGTLPSPDYVLLGTASGAASAPRNDLQYHYQKESDGTFTNSGKKYLDDTTHTVLLRRLANPYIAGNPTDNQYVTVDVMRNVRANDAVKNVTTPGTRSMSGLPTPANTNSSFARVQPYTGSNALTLRQDVNPAPVAPAPLQKVSFFRHNSRESVEASVTPSDPNLVTPFEWMPHFDRRLINAEELLNVPVSRPHELTLHFAQPASGGGRPLFHQYTLRTAVEQRNPVFPATIVPPSTAPTSPPLYAPLYRALELLTVKPWTSDIPHGGRVPGKINPNAIQDKLVFDAWIDQQTGTNKFTVTERDELWKQLMLSRSGFDTTLPPPPPVAPNLYPRVLGNSYDEVGPTPSAPGSLPSHRPFKHFGVGQFPGGAAELVQFPTGVEDTLMRHLPSTSVVTQSDPNRTPATTPLFSRYEAQTPPSGPTIPNQPRAGLIATDPVVPYTEAEPLRKLLNNLTTTSDTFQLVFTVGYFEAREYQPGQSPGQVILGKELFLKVPGDLRSQFTSVIDRSMLTQQLQTTSTPMAVLESREPLPPAPTIGATYNSNPATVTGERGLVLALNAAYPAALPSAIVSATRLEELMVSGAMEATGVYEGRKITVSPGTVLYVGTGANRMRVKAYFDTAAPNGPSRWTYNPLTGTVRISYQVDGPTQPAAALKDYPAGSMVTNYEFGPQTTAPLDATTNPAVLYFGRLTP